MPNLPECKSISCGAPLVWLRKGARDFRQCVRLSSANGLLIFLFGWGIGIVTWPNFWLLAGAFSGFLVVAPVLATSHYAMSRALGRREAVNLKLLVRTWTRWQHSRYAAPDGYWVLVKFGLALGAAGTGWVLTSAAFVTLLSVAPVTDVTEFVRHIVIEQSNHLFELWAILGGLLAAPIFASSVISMPLLLDRRVTVLEAVLTSWATVLRNPVPLAIWAVLIVTTIAIGFATLLVGLIVILPILGHASWHAYQDLVDTTKLEERLPPETWWYGQGPKS